MLSQIHFFREAADPVPGTIDAEQDEPSHDEKEKRIIRCRLCAQALTDPTQRTEIDGSHNHAFFNPSGIAYEISCFRKAPGCLVHGEPSSEFTWFAGHSWQFVLCSACLTHLGWFFLGRENSFFGLINKKITGS